MLRGSAIGLAGLLWLYTIYLKTPIEPQRQLGKPTYTCRLHRRHLFFFIRDRNTLFTNFLMTQNRHVYDSTDVLLCPFTMRNRFTKPKLKEAFSEILYSFYLKLIRIMHIGTL